MHKYPGQESSTLEFKRALPHKNQIIHTIIGFCNLFGGRLVIGVNDDGTIRGINEEKVGEIIESLEQSIYHSCTPTILPEIYTQRFSKKLVLIIEVSLGMNKPYFHTSEGLSNGTYIRSGSLTVKASPEMI